MLYLNRSLLPVVLAGLVFLSCHSVPLTGRNQLNIIPSSTMLSMSAQEYNSFLQSNPKSNDQANAALVQNVGQRIQGAVERFMTQEGAADQLAGYKWEFNLVQSDQVNAWAMPGGKVVFYTGILPITQNETGIAVVMGHEVAHAIAEHGNERMSQGLIAQFGAIALSEALKNKPEQTQALYMTAFGLGAQFGAILPFSRLQESEADHLGLIFMAMAGYDPNAAVAFWERMAANKGSQAPPEFMSTHPSDQTRIAKIREALPEAMQYYKP
jgi:predicted Zn-dependent protease